MICEASEPPVVIPTIVVAIDVHVPLIVPTIERGHYVQNVIHATTLRILSGLNLIRHHNALTFCTK